MTKAAIDKLLKLKLEYKEATGKDYAPAAGGQPQGKQDKKKVWLEEKMCETFSNTRLEIHLQKFLNWFSVRGEKVLIKKIILTPIMNFR